MKSMFPGIVAHNLISLLRAVAGKRMEILNIMIATVSTVNSTPYATWFL